MGGDPHPFPPPPPLPRNASRAPGRSSSACPSTQWVRGWWEPMEPRWHYQFRVIMLGDSTVGKSSLLRRYTEGVFLDAVNQTVGVDFYVQFVELEPGLQVKLQFWDTAGQERFRWVLLCSWVGGGGRWIPVGRDQKDALVGLCCLHC